MFPKLTNDELLAIDIESNDPGLKELGPGARRKESFIIGVGIATEDKEYYFDVQKPLEERKGKRTYEEVIDQEKVDTLKAWLKTIEHKKFVGANITYDLDFLQYWDFKPSLTYDVQMAEALIDENLLFYNLESLGQRYFKKGKTTNELELYCKEHKLGKNVYNVLIDIPSELVGKYCKDDCRLTFDVFQKQLPIIKDEELEDVFKLESDIIPYMLKIKASGIRINVPKMKQLKESYAKEIEEKKKALTDLCGFEVNTSAAKSIEKAFNKFGYGYGMTEKGNPSFPSSFLEAQDHELAKMILELRHLTKIHSTYLEGMEKFLVGDRIHCTFNQLRADNTGTVSGRFCCKKPNMQKITNRNERFKKDIRGLFLPEENQKLAKIDYRQEEMVIFAHYARGEGSDELRETYLNDPKADMYKIFAAVALNKDVSEVTKAERKLYKTVALGVLYGMGTDTLGRQIGIITKKGSYNADTKVFWNALFKSKEWDSFYEALHDDQRLTNFLKAHNVKERSIPYAIENLRAWKVLNDLHKKLPCMKETTKACQEVAENRGYVKTILGRRRRFDEPRFCYKAFNAVDQGSGGDVMKTAIRHAFEEGLDEILTFHLTVHDELVVSTPPTLDGEDAVKRLKDCMENAIALKVPLRVDIEIGENWSDVEEVEL